MTEANPVQIPADPQHSLDDKQQNTKLLKSHIVKQSEAYYISIRLQDQTYIFQ